MGKKQQTIVRLANYLGILQLVHIFVLFYALGQLIEGYGIGFPALPPESGWGNLEKTILLVLGFADLIIIIACFVFIGQVSQGKRGIRKTGLIATGGFLLTAAVFALVIVTSGALVVHPLFYAVMTLLFIPVPVLFFKLLNST